MSTWPVATLGRIQRLHVLAAGLPGCAVAERRFPLPFEQVWSVLGDIERSGPAFDIDVRAVSVRRRDGDRLRILSWLPWRYGGLPVPFDVELREGWCWMVSRPRGYVVGMAAEPNGPDVTRFAHLEGMTIPYMYDTSRRRHRRHLEHDLDGMERLLGLRP